MAIRLPSRKAAVISAAALILIYLLFGWLALPPLLQSQAEKFVAEKSGHRLTMDKPEFNPFTLALRLHNLHLTEPDGKPLLAFKQLLVDFSAGSLFRRAYVFDAIRLDGLEATVDQRRDGRLNWSALIDSLGSKEPPAPKPEAAASPLPRLEVRSLIVADGHLEVGDHRTAPGFSSRVEPLDIELNDLSTLPNEKGQYEISAHTGFGAAIRWQGEVELNPLAVAGDFSIEGVSLAKLAPLMKLPANLAAPEGTAALAAHYRVTQAQGQIDVTLDQVLAKLAGLKVRSAGNDEPVVTLDSIEARDGRFDLRQRSVTVGTITIAGGGVDAVRAANGRLNLLDLVPPAAPAAATPAKGAPEEAPWHYRIDRLALSGLHAGFRDQSLSPAAQARLEDIAINVTGISDDLKAPLPVHASFRADAGGSFDAEGKVVAADPSAEFQIKLADLSLKPVQPYLGALTTLTLTDGKVSVDGHASYGAKGVAYKGALAVRDLRITEGDSRTVFLAWKSLASRNLEATQDRLAIGDLNLDGLDTRLIIAKDKSVNVTKILRPQPAPPPSAASAPAKASKAPPFLVNIDRLHIVRSQMEYADYSLALPFGTRIHDLHGSINGLSSRPGAPGQLELDGQVDEYGLARAAGQIDLFDPTAFTDLKVVFRNVEMTRLTPYSATFAGRKIDSGKLSLDLEYKIKDRQLAGDNQVIMDSLKLGERVDSPEAKNLPLDLAIAILQDSDGRIDLGLPVSGNLDDPQFSYGQIVWKAIVNVLTKIVTAPFRALGKLFGNGEKVESIAFDPGRAQLTPPEREKLVKLADALGKRPKLALAIGGTYTASDRVALQDLQLRRTLAARMGQQVNDKTDPGPMSTAQPKVQSALEGLFSDRFGGAELAALKDGFRKANPGQLPESTAGKLLSGLSGMFREKRTLNEDEVAKLKGADFYGVLFDRLRAREAITDDRLKALASERGDFVLATLKAAGAPTDRISVLAPEKVDVEGDSVPLKMDLKAAGGTATAAAPPAAAEVPATK
jgi:uncharacterized protein involved in outer membrane biogenesis